MKHTCGGTSERAWGIAQRVGRTPQTNRGAVEQMSKAHEGLAPDCGIRRLECIKDQGSLGLNPVDAALILAKVSVRQIDKGINFADPVFNNREPNLCTGIRITCKPQVGFL